MWHILVLFALFTTTQGRAVNISNTWVLPEEGFPVFYRYFRDRISWYEADAVCQFHHANLVTVDTTAQYDAVRAYLKELDISSAVWVGLIRSNPDGDFTWTDYRGLSGDGYWSSAPDARAAPLCAAADPAADYRWEARACGGPTVASFICELPVPQWALGKEGCMVRALPALTILYLPESAAVQLTADCGLAGVKRVQCTGNVKRDDLLKNLSCAEEEEPSSTLNAISTSVTWPVTTDTASTEQDITSEVTTDENLTTEHEDDINQTIYVKSTPIPYSLNVITQNKILENKKSNSKYFMTNKNMDLNIIHDNNLQSNEIPQIGNSDNFATHEHLEKIEDEKHMQHKMLHDELARLGNFETIFTQPTDHFVPPLVMARAKISDDMTVLSLKEKHAQTFAEETRHITENSDHDPSHTSVKSTKKVIDIVSPSVVSDNPLIMTMSPLKSKDSQIYRYQDKIKSSVPKKYHDKQLEKNKTYKTESKSLKLEKVTDSIPKQTKSTIMNIETTTHMEPLHDIVKNKSEEDPTVDLAVIINENHSQDDDNVFSGDVPKIDVITNNTSIKDLEMKIVNTGNVSTEAKQEISVKIPTHAKNLTASHEIIKITIINEENSTFTPTILEITTKMPVFDDILENKSKINETSTRVHDSLQLTTNIPTDKNVLNRSVINTEKTDEDTITTKSELSTYTTTHSNKEVNNINGTTIVPALIETTISDTYTTISNKNVTDIGNNSPTVNSPDLKSTNVRNITSDDILATTESYTVEKNLTESSIYDFQSPLLSAANEPLHRPNRSRRPQQQQSRINKFNPFRILG